MATVETTTATNAPGFSITLDNGEKIQLESGQSTKFEDDFDEIPLLDLQNLFSDNIEDRKILAKQLYKVCHEVGFFYVKNHHIPEEHIKAAFDISKKFFKLPDEKKMEVYTGLYPAEEYSGFHPMLTYNRANQKYNDLYEAFNWHYDPKWDPVKPEDSKASRAFQNHWPPAMPEMEKVLMTYEMECLKLARKMIRLVALAFELPEDYFDKAVEAPASGMRIIRYPVQKNGETEQNGIGPHTDFQTLTLLNVGEVSGLQVINKRGHWVAVPPIEGTLVVNVGDCLTRITNGKFVSTIHRVVNNLSGVTRYSIPFFLGFDYDYMMAPLPGTVTPENPQKYESMTSEDYVRLRGKKATANNQKK